MEVKRSKFEISVEEGHHRSLLKLQGNWSGSCRTWFEKDVLAEEQSISARVEQLLEGRFIKITYQSSLMGKPFTGEMTIGYDLANNKCQSAWVDSFHMGTGIMLSEGSATADGFYLEGHYGNPEMPEPWGWHTQLTFTTDNTFVLTAFNVPPGSTPEKATESTFTRVS